MASLAIVGAGASGLAAAWALRDTSLSVTVFEKSRGYSGRAATRRRNGTRYDHGANYIKPTSERITTLLTEHLPTDELEDIGRAIWTFDADGTVSPGDRETNQEPKWTYRSGIHTLGKHLAAAADATVHLQTRIAALEVEDTVWTLADTDGERHGPFDAVLLTPPAPQTAALLRASTMPDALQDTLVDGVDAASYTSQFAFILSYDTPIPRPDGVYALLNTDRQHPIAWLSFEDDKPGHVPKGESLLIAQMAPDWTTARMEDPPDALVDEVVPEVANVLDADLGAPAWFDTQRWRYALPTKAADADALAAGAPYGLFFAGDALVGRGRVGRALETGLDAADAIRRTLRE